MQVQAARLATALRVAGYEAAARAADAAAAPIEFSEGDIEELLSTYRLRREFQLKDGRPGVARQIGSLLDALEAHSDTRVLGGRVHDENHTYVVWLDRSAASVLAVVVPPRLRSGGVADNWGS